MKPSKRVAMAVMLAAAPWARADVFSDAGNVTLHLTASDLALADGAAVSNWSGLTQANPDKQPTYVADGINGQAVVRFNPSGFTGDADGDALVWSGANIHAQTVFVVANVQAYNSLGGLVSNNSDGLNIRLNSATTYRSPGNAQDQNDFTGAGGTGVFRVNGVATASYAVGTPHIVTATAAAMQTYGSLALGSPKVNAGGAQFPTRYLQGDVAEVVMYDGKLSTSSTNAVLRQLSSTYNIAVTQVKAGTVVSGLIGHDLTDPEDDGAADANTGYNATFSSNNEPGFGGGEFAFNVFDNRTGGNNDKWCCDAVGTNNSDGAPYHWVAAHFDQAYQLTTFTLTSSNDTPDRDPRSFAIQGSTDGVNWTDLFVQDDLSTDLWTGRSQTIRFDTGTDFNTPGYYTDFRFVAYHTNLPDTGGGGDFALGEIELFGTASVPDPAALPTAAALGGLVLLRRRRG